jgi:hypothetical protein
MISTAGSCPNFVALLVTSDAGLLCYREVDEALCPTDTEALDGCLRCSSAQVEHDLPLSQAPKPGIMARNSPGIQGMSTEYSGEQRNSL